jgi:hypothetical protein
MKCVDHCLAQESTWSTRPAGAQFTSLLTSFPQFTGQRAGLGQPDEVFHSGGPASLPAALSVAGLCVCGCRCCCPGRRRRAHSGQPRAALRDDPSDSSENVPPPALPVPKRTSASVIADWLVTRRDQRALEQPDGSGAYQTGSLTRTLGDESRPVGCWQCAGRAGRRCLDLVHWTRGGRPECQPDDFGSSAVEAFAATGSRLSLAGRGSL